MKVSISGLKGLLATGIVELRFRRRRPRANAAPVRRMLCTNNAQLLNSVPGHVALNFKPPTQPPKYNPARYNLVFAWDLLWQEYRAISLEDHEVLAVMPLKSEEDVQKFWQYFNEILHEMSGSQKMSFMNS